MLERIDHVNLVVEDLRATTAFYRELLGMRVVREVTIGGPWIQTLTGLPGAEAEVVYLEADPGTGLELIRYRNPQGPRPPDQGNPNTKGIRHVAFRVRDLDALVGRLAAAGVDLLSEVQDVPTTQVDFEAQQKRLVYCRDPEGNLLELCQYT